MHTRQQVSGDSLREATFVPVPPSRGDRPEVHGVFARVAFPAGGYPRAPKWGDLSVYDWYGRTRVQWAYVLYLHGHAVGYIGAQQSRTAPGGLLLPAPRTWEMSQVILAPECREPGAAAALVELAERTFVNTVWSACDQGSDHHRMLSARGWQALPTPPDQQSTPSKIVLGYPG